RCAPNTGTPSHQAGTRVVPAPEALAPFGLAGRDPHPPPAQALGAPLRRGLLDRCPPGPQPPGQRGVPGQVDALLHGDHGGQRDVEDLLGAAVLAPRPSARSPRPPRRTPRPLPRPPPPAPGAPEGLASRDP